MSGDVLTAPEATEDVPRKLTTRHSLQDRLFIHGVSSVGCSCW